MLSLYLPLVIAPHFHTPQFSSSKISYKITSAFLKNWHKFMKPSSGSQPWSRDFFWTLHLHICSLSLFSLSSSIFFSSHFPYFIRLIFHVTFLFSLFIHLCALYDVNSLIRPFPHSFFPLRGQLFITLGVRVG